MIEHPITTQRANDYADALEPSTAAIRALNDAMAAVCEGLLAGAQSHRAEPPEQQEQSIPTR